MLTHAELLEQLIYHPETGTFERKKGKRIGKSLTKNGYKLICVKHKQLYAHRLAWFYVNGDWPSSLVDHINGNRADNRIHNLRLATKAQNAVNSKVVRSSSGRRGVYIQSNTRKYRVRLTLNGKRNVHIGYFSSKEEAAKARNEAMAKAYGAFARAA